MSNRGHDQGWCSSGLRKHVGQRDKTIGHDRPGCRRARVQGIDDLVLLTRAPQRIIDLEAARGERMQMREHLQRCALPGVYLTGHRGRHGERGGDCTSEWRIIEARTHDVEGEIGTLEGRRITGAREGGGRDDLGCPRPDSAIPEQPVDLLSGRIAGLADARQSGECGEGIAQYDCTPWATSCCRTAGSWASSHFTSWALETNFRSGYFAEASRT